MMTMTSQAAEENKKVAVSFANKLLNENNLSLIEEPVSSGSAGTSGISNVGGMIRTFLTAFSNHEHRIIEAIAEGDEVCLRFSGKAIHTHSYLGLLPTGKRVNVWGIMIVRIERGRVIELWDLFDLPSVLKQLRDE